MRSTHGRKRKSEKALDRRGKTYLIVAGPHDDAVGTFQLYTWAGPGAPTVQPLDVGELGDLRPEAVIPNDGDTRLLLMSDDGSRRVESSEGQCNEDFERVGNVGTCPCKRLKDASLQRFRARWVTLP